jgi:hypothetical protein
VGGAQSDHHAAGVGDATGASVYWFAMARERETPSVTLTRLGSAPLGLGIVLLAIALGMDWICLRDGRLVGLLDGYEVGGGRTVLVTGVASILAAVLVFLGNLGGSRAVLTRVCTRLGLVAAALMVPAAAMFSHGEQTSSGFTVFVVGWTLVVLGLIDHWPS